MTEIPGNVFKAPQRGQRAVHMAPDATSIIKVFMTAAASATATVRMTAPHSLQVISA
jgi:hypothetical protein